MKIRFRQSGGFAGLIQGCELDTDFLSTSEADQLKSLVEQSGILQARSQFMPDTRDLYNYEITVEIKERTVRLRFDDMTRPEGIEKLLKYLQQKAQPRTLS